MLRIQSMYFWVTALSMATVAAQEPGVSSQPELSAAVGPAQAMDPGAEAMFQQAKLYEQMMQSAVKRGDKQRQVALVQKDLVKLNCLNEKMARATEHARAAQRALSDLGDAVIRSDTTGRQLEFSRIRLLHQKVQVLEAEANSCAGEDLGFVGPSQAEIEVDLTVPAGDPTDPGLPTPDSTLLPSGTARSAQPSSPMMPDNTGLGGL